MATIAAADVKKLRDATSAGMMVCKKALEESGGDFDKAVEILRISGAAKAAKRGAERTASNVELACETDFVAKGDKFVALSEKVLDAVSAAGATSVEAALAAPAGSQTVAELIADEAAILGEKIELRRLASFSGDKFSIYLHQTSQDLPPQVGVVVAYTGDDAETARAIAQHISFADAQMFLQRTSRRSVQSLPKSAATRASPKRSWRRSLTVVSLPTSSRSLCSSRNTLATTSSRFSRSLTTLA